MTIAALVTEGIGSYGNVAHVITDGLDIGAVPSTNVIATILTEGFGMSAPASAFVVTEGFGASSTPTPSPTPGRSGLGGDDVPRRRRKSPDRGFDLEAWKARQPDFEGTIRNAYDQLMRGPVAEEVLDIVAPHTEVEDDSIDWQALFADDRALSDLVRLHEMQMMEEEAIVSLLIH